MKKLSTIVFPNTIPSAEQLTSLLPLFEPVVYCRPVENDTLTTTGANEKLFLADHNLCRLNTPAPLGEDRERFMQLISDLATRRDDYAAQLGSLTLASLNLQGFGKTETRNSILAQLLHSQGIENRKEEKKNLLLWQARLVLKLAEIVDSEEESLAAGMQSVGRRERALFNAIREDDDNKNPFTAPGPSPAVTTESEKQAGLRLKAWSRLFAAGAAPETNTVFTTFYSDAVDRLSEKYERIRSRAPKKIISVPLPAALKRVDVKDYLGRRHRFRNEGAVIIDQLASVLAGNGRKKEGGSRMLPDMDNGSWRTLLEQNFPAELYARRRLTCFEFGNISAAELFLTGFGRDDDRRDLLPTGEEDGPGRTIIGLLE